MTVGLEVEPLHISGSEIAVAVIVVLRAHGAVPGIGKTLSHLEAADIGLSKIHIAGDLRAAALGLRPAGGHAAVLIEAVDDAVDGLGGHIVSIGMELLAGTLIKIEPVGICAGLSAGGQIRGQCQLLPAGLHISVGGVTVVIVAIHPAGLHHTAAVKVVILLVDLHPAVGLDGAVIGGIVPGGTAVHIGLDPGIGHHSTVVVLIYGISCAVGGPACCQSRYSTQHGHGSRCQQTGSKLSSHVKSSGRLSALLHFLPINIYACTFKNKRFSLNMAENPLRFPYPQGNVFSGETVGCWHRRAAPDRCPSPEVPPPETPPRRRAAHRWRFPAYSSSPPAANRWYRNSAERKVNPS